MPAKPTDSCLPAALLALLREADRAIRRLEAEPYRLYEFLHETTGRFAPVDIFYVSLYSAAHRALFFPYNVDCGVYEVPETYFLADGPTSQAVKQRRAVVWNTEAGGLTCGGLRFGQTDRVSLSAMHVPIRAGADGPDAPVVGVLSAQSYQAGAYPPQAVRAMQWLADSAAQALARERDAVAWSRRLQDAESRTEDRKPPLIVLADECVGLIQDLSRRAEDIRRQLPAEADPALLSALDALCREGKAAQTKASQLPLRSDLCPLPAPRSALDTLTTAERAVLQAIAAGQPNKAIARTQNVSENTVKTQCKSIFAKLGVSCRTAAARLWLDAAPRL